MNAGCVVAVGHSNATSEDAAAAFRAGASSVTHIFNAQTGWDHRNPGLAAAALADPDALLTLIVDGHHLSDDTVRALFQSAAHRCALITDAIAAAGEGDGTSDLGDRQVHVDGGRATLSDGTLAGAVATMDEAVRNVHGLGIDLAAALSAASEVPGRAVVGADLGTIREGAPADLVVLDDRLDVHLTMKGGHETYTA